ncbi:ATP-NAD kinase-like domain-containing protein [Hypoxylon argillaceum]|nr:ATP-NAD kinase-like domain-containing protein [Hypoxylon argillaceum]KAI1155726.1 ATP-NAD kinase-like domain-containing protein [Nemania diffusa]
MSDNGIHAHAPSHDGSRGIENNRHVHYEVDTHSLASDDDMRELEVTFDPTSPYRRKSSLVPSDHAYPHNSHQHLKKPFSSDCLVHQLLESHKLGGLTLHSPEKHEDVSNELGLNSYVEPKGNSERRSKESGRISLIESESDDSSASGQIDEKSWKTEVTKSRSELDLAGQEHETIHSRLLTKKQLTEMAWGVRELSRRLGMVRLKFKVENIFLLTKVYDEDLIPKTRELAKWLLSKDRDVRYIIYIQDTFKENKSFDMPGLIEELRSEYIEAGELDEDAPVEAMNRRIRFWTEDMCRRRPHTFDFIITLGGDGTVLYASWLFQRIVPPVLSFALGSLGFLTKFDFNEYRQSLNTAFTAGVTVSLRLRFEGTVMRSQDRKKYLELDQEIDGTGLSLKRDLVEELIGEEKDDEHTHKPDGTYEILNEIVVDRGPNPTLANIEVFGDDEHFTSVLADGVCVSTPTGSTAYNLAAGGSLCHPENPVMLVTAICAHTLSFRPIILPDTIVLRLGVPYDARTSSWASFDGRRRVELQPGDYVTISASRFPFASVQPQGRRSEDWVNSISGKLGWNTRQKQKNEGFKKWD